MRGGWDQLPPPQIWQYVQRCPVSSVSVQAWKPWRGRSPAARRQGEQERESSEEHVLPFYRVMCACAEYVRVCPRTCSSCHACCPLRQVRSCPSTRYSVRKRFPAGRCGSFFRGNVETKLVHSDLLHLAASFSARTDCKVFIKFRGNKKSIKIDDYQYGIISVLLSFVCWTLICHIWLLQKFHSTIHSGLRIFSGIDIWQKQWLLLTVLLELCCQYFTYAVSVT